MRIFAVAQRGGAQVECLVPTPSVKAAVPAVTNLDFAGDTPATTVVWMARPNCAEDSAHYSPPFGASRPSRPTKTCAL